MRVGSSSSDPSAAPIFGGLRTLGLDGLVLRAMQDDMAFFCQQACCVHSRASRWFEKAAVGQAQEQRDAQTVLATMDHADIRGLITALHLSVAGLPAL